MKPVSKQYRLEYLDGRIEMIEFTARTTEVAAQAIANRWMMKETPLKTITAPDGHVFKIQNDNPPERTEG